MKLISDNDYKLLYALKRHIKIENTTDMLVKTNYCDFCFGDFMKGKITQDELNSSEYTLKAGNKSVKICSKCLKDLNELIEDEIGEN